MSRQQEQDDLAAWLWDIEEQLQLVQAQLSQHVRDHEREA
jgi:hypothetical protein